MMIDYHLFISTLVDENQYRKSYRHLYGKFIIIVVIFILTRDEDTLSAILVSNNYHVENTIETVLSMSGEEETPSSAVTPMPANSAPIPPQPSTGLDSITT